jgi:hypothetical protein
MQLPIQTNAKGMTIILAFRKSFQNREAVKLFPSRNFEGGLAVIVPAMVSVSASSASSGLHFTIWQKPFQACMSKKRVS